MTAVVGRELEFSRTERVLDEARERYVGLVLEGEAGIGKTTVWREVVGRAEERGFLVLACRPAAAETGLSLAAIADLLEGVPEQSLDALPAPQRRALEVAVFRMDPASEALEPRLLATAVRTLVTQLASKQPVLVALDDVQWIDTASSVILEFVLRRLKTERVGLLASHRLGEPPGLVTALLSDPERVTAINLGPLSMAALHHVLRQQLGEAPSRSLLVRIHEASAGNPLFAIQIARLLAEVGPPPVGEPLPVPPDVETLVRTRIASFPPSTREVLLTAAALDKPREESVRLALGRAIERDLQTAQRAQIAKLERGIVTLAHPLFAAAVLSSASAADRRRIHRRLAEIAEDAEERARHLALAVEGRDERTATAVHAAARDALFRGAPAAAAELVELALRLGEAESEGQRRRTTDLADYLYAAGDSMRARAVLEEVDSWEEWSARLQARALALLGKLVGETEHPASAIEYLERLLRKPLSAEARAALYTELSYATSEVDPVRSADHAEAALALLEPLGDEADPGIHVSALYMRLRARVLLGEGLERALVDRIRAIEARISPERRSLDRVSPSVAYWLKYVDDLETSRRWLERARQEGVKSGNESDQLHALVHLAFTECWAGNLELSHRYALSSLGLAEELNAGLAALLAAEALALVNAHLGNVQEVRAIAERQPRPASVTRHGTIFFGAALGLAELSLGNFEAADVQLRAALEAEEQVGIREPGIHRMHANAAETAVALGDLERAQQIGGFLGEHGQRTGHRWSLATSARVRALIAGAAGDLEEALAVAVQAVELHDELPMPFERARTLLVKGVIERRARRRTRAEGSLGQALEIFERIGARIWAERARAELDRVGLRRKAGDELTEGERRVAELAAQGLPNREVAAALFISPKTVEANLSRVYRKLGVRSRAELGSIMAERRQGDIAATT